MKENEEKIAVREENPNLSSVERGEEIQEEIDTDETLIKNEPMDDNVLVGIESLKKHDAAVFLINKTKELIDDTQKQLDTCKLQLQDDLKSYNEAKTSLEKHALGESRAILEKLVSQRDEVQEPEEDKVVFEPKEEIPPFYVRDISSGKFSSFLLALLAGVLTLAGLFYLAAAKVGVTIDITKVPSHETATKVLGWYATLFGGKPDLFLGGAFVFIVALFVMGLIYGLRVASRASSNLAFAKNQFEEAQEYAKHKGNCKEEMDMIDAHMNDAIKTLKTFEVVLHEQNGKLKRIMHIEGIKESLSTYHEKSQREIHDTDMLVTAIKNFIGTSMSEEGKLSGKSTMFLHSAKSKLQKFLNRHY